MFKKLTRRIKMQRASFSLLYVQSIRWDKALPGLIQTSGFAGSHRWINTVPAFLLLYLLLFFQFCQFHLERNQGSQGDGSKKPPHVMPECNAAQNKPNEQKPPHFSSVSAVFLFVRIGRVPFKGFAIPHLFHNQQFAVGSVGIGGGFAALVGPGAEPHFAHCIIQVADIVAGTLL